MIIKRFIKFAAAFTVSFFTIIICTFGVQAVNIISNIDIDTVLSHEGDAQIKQIWTGNFAEGTECYFPIKTGSYLTVNDLKVRLGEKEFDFVDKWDTSLSFSSKAYKCGLNPIEGGYEICWGISDYGNNAYEISYTVGNMLCAYDESDGFNFRFVNSGMTNGPTDANLTIRTADGTPLNSSNSKIWAFGYDGEIIFDKGSVYAYSSSPLKKNNHITVMLEVEKDIFEPQYTINSSFDRVKKEAFKGSDYDSSDGKIPLAAIILIVILSVFFLAFIISILIYYTVRNRRNKRFMKDAGYYRDIPCKGDIFLAYRLCSLFDSCPDSRIVSAGLLSLAAQECILPVTQTQTGAFGKEKSSSVMRLCKAPEENNKFHSLYQLIEKAAGEDGILSEKELKNYTYKNPDALQNFINKSKISGNSVIKELGLFSSRPVSDVRKLTDTGKEYLKQTAGFKNYLKDFSLIAEHEVSEVSVWREYLVYGVLYGIADKVASQLKKLYPEIIPQIENFEWTMTTADMWGYMMWSSMHRRQSEIQAQRSSGGGGHASFGGGGGFSGGGFGGGTR